MLTDFHIHSACSPDAYDTMEDMAKSSREHGVSIMCFTDHVDMDDYVTGKLTDKAAGFLENIHKTYAKLKDNMPEGIEVLCGMELGQANHDPERAKELAKTSNLDFIIASLHNLKDTPDFSENQYFSIDDCKKTLSAYLAESIELATIDCFDVMGHIGYTQRYMMRDGFNIPITMKNYGDELTELFKTLIANGKGIEINCAGYRGIINDTIPASSVLGRYRELGGEIITVGSDAHCVADASIGNAKGYEALKRAGFEYVSIFRNRKVEFIKI